MTRIRFEGCLTQSSFPSAPGTPNAKRMIIIRWPMNLRASALQHGRAADPPLGGARPGRSSTSCTSCRASSSCPRTIARSPSPIWKFPSAKASACGRRNSRRACSRRFRCGAPTACSRSAPAAVISRRFFRIVPRMCSRSKSTRASPSSAAPTSSGTAPSM